MAFSVADLASAADSTDQQDYTTASFTPTADRLLLAVVAVRDDTALPGTPTVSGGSLTWTLATDGSVSAEQTFDVIADPQIRVTAHWADSGGSPSSFAVTFDYPAGTQQSAAWSVYEIDGTPRDATAFVQIVLGREDANTAAAITLAAFGDTANRPFGFFSHDKSETKTVSTSFAAIGNVSTANQNVSMLTEWRDAVDTGLDPSWATSGSWGGFAIELAATAVGSGQAALIGVM